MQLLRIVDGVNVACTYYSSIVQGAVVLCLGQSYGPGRDALTAVSRVNNMTVARAYSSVPGQ